MLKHSSRLLGALGLTIVVVSGVACGDQDPNAKVDQDSPATVATVAQTEEALRSQGYRGTPGGMVHESCIHAVEADDVVNDDGSIRRADGRLEPFVPCAYPVHASHGSSAPITPGSLAPTPESVTPDTAAPDSVDGWREWVQWTSPANIGSFTAQFHVPAPPKLYLAQEIYLFNGLGGSGTSRGILQPVLQYGKSPAGGGQYWAIASWFGGTPWGNNYYHSGLIRVNVGEVITGTMKIALNDCPAAGCRWDIRATESTHGGWSGISVHTHVAWRTVYGGVLETHYAPYCEQYPATYDNFFNFDVRNTAGTRYFNGWTTENASPRMCGENVTHSNTLVNLNWPLSTRP